MRCVFLLLALLVTGCASEETSTPDPRVDSFLRAGTQALHQRKFQAALAWADSAEAYTPNAPGAAFLRARVYSELLQFDSAEAAYQEVLHRDPAFRGVWNNRGNNALQNGKLRQALAFYRKELAQHTAAIPWNGLGRTYMRLRRPDSARISFRRAIAQDSSYVRAYLGLAKLYSESGQFRKGLKPAQHALELQPENPEAQYQVGLLLRRTGQYAAALPHLQAARRMQPWRAAVHYNLGRVLLRLGQKEAAQAHLDSAQTLTQLQDQARSLQGFARSHPENPEAYEQLGKAYQELGRAGKALRMYRTALYLNPHDYRLRYRIGVLFLEEGVYPAAIRWLHSAVRKHPTFTEAWLKLGEAYLQAGDTARAQRVRKVALQLD